MSSENIDGDYDPLPPPNISELHEENTAGQRVTTTSSASTSSRDELYSRDKPNSTGAGVEFKSQEKECMDDTKLAENLGALEVAQQRIHNINELPVAQLRRILSFLRFWDLLPCRLVSRRWNSEITEHTTFTQRSFILLSPERLPVLPELVPQFLERLNPSIARLRMIRIPRSHFTPAFEADFAKNLVQLELLYCSTMTWSTLIEILTSCPSLEELTIRRTVFKWPYDSEEWRSKFTEFSSQIQRSGKSFPALKSVEFRVKDPHDVLYMCKFILENSQALQRLSFSCKSPLGGLKLNSGNDDADDMYETIHEMFEVLVEILKKFGPTLHTFHSYLIDPPVSRVTPIGSPSTSTVSQKSSNNNNSVHEREASIMNVYCSEVLSKVDWSKIDLKSFCLYGGEISNFRIPTETDILASVLSSQQSLEKVILPRMKFHTEREFQKFLHHIPRGIKCIRVPTFGRMPESISFEFHKLTEYYIEAHGTPDLQVIVPSETILPNVRTFSFYNCSDWVWQTVRMTTIINSFPCLTELLIRDDGTHQCTRIGDTDLQNICRYLPQLKKLHMTNVDCVTDFGFTGICERECKFMNEVGSFVPSPGTKIGYSIASLTRLEYLCLFKIGFRVTNISLVLGFTFPCLRCLMLEGYPKVTPYGVEKLKSNNSKLKKWNLQFHDDAITQVVENLQRQEVPFLLPFSAKGGTELKRLRKNGKQ